MKIKRKFFAIVPCGGLDCTVEHLFVLLVNIYNLLLGLAALVAMLFIVFGGLRMFYWSVMEDSAGELESAKRTVSRAITGFAMIALAYLIVNTVLVLLGVNPGSALGVLLGNLGFLD